MMNFFFELVEVELDQYVVSGLQFNFDLFLFLGLGTFGVEYFMAI